MQVKNKIKGLVQVDWLTMEGLQPDNIKLPFNYEHLKQSILKYGFTIPFAVWIDKGTTYVIDGHHRKDLLMNLQGEGIDVPKLLPAYEIEAKDRKQAIEILLECLNMKHNPFDIEILQEWIEVEQVEVNVDSLNVKIVPMQENEVDYSILDEDDEINNQLDNMASGVKKAIQIEFEAEHYEEAFSLVKFWREQKSYVGGMIMEYLKAEKEKL